ncbi:MAG: outer membrane protein assembly factor BamC [Betaproteobacteria bacterium]|nr:outer membrane protein assembly factor BamC [Betaproteobacteria bacterium]
MKSSMLFRSLSLALGLVVLAGCGTTNLFEGKKIDYKSAGKLPPLEVPPDLTSPTADDRYAVPDVSPQGTATYSAYTRDRTAQPQGQSGVLPVAADKVRIERAGTQRWLVVQGAPEQVWPVVKEFWQEIGFIVNIEKPETGVMETDWAENRAKIPLDPVRSFLGRVVDQLYSTAERDKFRTRLERATDGTSTEIYISHRRMEEVFVSEAKDTTKWQPAAADPDLEAEMLGRLMVRFGVEDTRSRSLLAGGSLPERAKIAKDREGISSLALDEAFDRAWRRVGLALDRVGFTVEDRDRSKGLYYVRYVDPELDAQKKDDKGFLSKLAFWRSDDSKKTPLQYRIQVRDTGAASTVNVLNKDGGPEKSDVANRIISLLFEQLK